MSNFAANLLGATSLAIADQIQAAAQEVMQHSGETPAALVVIGYGFGPSNDELKRILGLSHPGTVRLVDRLVADGLVERRPGTDKRSIALHLTDQGAQKRRTLLDKRLSAIKSMLGALSEQEQATLADLLSTMMRSLNAPDLERCHLCRLCDRSVCAHCPIPADFEGKVRGQPA